MTTVGVLCELVRSKNAGPFWVTIDLFFKSKSDFARYARSPNLAAGRIAHIYSVNPAQVRHHYVESLALLKISFPRRTPQGGVEERDLHGGQQFVRLIHVDL